MSAVTGGSPTSGSFYKSVSHSLPRQPLPLPTCVRCTAGVLLIRDTHPLFYLKGLSALCTPFQFKAEASDSGKQSSRIVYYLSHFAIPMPSPRWRRCCGLPGVRADATHSLVGIAGKKSAAIRFWEAPPDFAAAAGPDLFQDPPYSRLPGGRRGSRPWLWFLVGRGHGPPHACPGAPTSAW